MTAPPRPPLTSRQAISATAILCVSIFIGATSWLAPLAILPQIATGLGSSVSLIGQISSMAIFLTALAAILIGPLIRRYGFRELFFGGIIAMVLSSAMLATASNILSILVASLLSSVANGIIFPVALTIAATELSPVAGRRAISYQVACVFGAVAVGMPATVLLANALGWHGAFVVLGGATALLLPFVWAVIPRGTPDPSARFDLPTVLVGYGDLLANRSLTLTYGFQMLYVVCAFGSGAYLSALMAARGFAPEEIAAVFAAAGGAFVVSSLVSGEVLGKVKLELRFVVILMAFLVCLTRGLIYILPLSVTVTIVLIGFASLADGVMANAIRALVVSYEVRDRALSMSFFAACDNLGQAFGGIICGFVLSVGGYPAIGALVFVVFVLSAGLPLASRQLIRVRSGALVR